MTNSKVFTELIMGEQVRLIYLTQDLKVYLFFTFLYWIGFITVWKSYQIGFLFTLEGIFPS